jgi:hypothetical protein
VRTTPYTPWAGPAGRAAAAAAALAAGAPDPDAEGAAGWPVFGQLVAHDITADRSPLTHHAELAEIRKARRAATWHYQWVLLQDFLPRVVGTELAGELLAGGSRFYRPDPGAAWIPLEFADAAYRYGHSQVRDRYQVNRDAEPVPLLPDLRGFRPVPAVLVVDWAYLFDLPGRPPAQRATRIDGRLAASLIRLPAAFTGVGSGDDYASLAIRDLQRGQGVGLPSGEALARRLGVEPLTPRRSASARPAGTRRHRSGSTCSRRPSTAAGASAWARWAAGWSARCWSASSTPTARATGPSTPAGVPPCPPPRRDASAWPTCWSSAPRSPEDNRRGNEHCVAPHPARP